MRIGIMQPYFFPYIGYFQLIDAVDIYVNLDHVSFMKRSYMTRNLFPDSSYFNIPVYGASQNKKCNEIFVNFENKYIQKTLQTLHQFYFKTPYYQIILDEIILPEFQEQEISISKFNINLIKRICDYLEIKTQIILSSNGLTYLPKGEGLKDIVGKLKGDIYINAIGGQKLYTKEDFATQNIDLKFIKMGDVEFNNPYSSILDLLFKYSKEYMQTQLKKYTLV